ncbi:Chitin deacetylase like protein [Verticillium longisporum]|nr:Chitin deacetylase like protein [Verticillium longisporum]
MYTTTVLSLLALTGTTLTAPTALHLRDSIPPSPTRHRRAPALGQTLYSCVNPGQVALTYDDGPYTFTSSLLDVLDEEGVTATFFLTGSNFGREMTSDPWSAIVQRTYAAGHQLASHTYTHPDLSALTPAARAADMAANDDAFRAILGFAPRYMRAPFLSCDAACAADMAALGFHIVDASIDTKDFEHNQYGTVYAAEAKFDAELGWDPAVDSAIVLAHDVHETTVSVLTRHMISTLRARGFRAVTVGECLGDSPDGWYKA